MRTASFKVGDLVLIQALPNIAQVLNNKHLCFTTDKKIQLNKKGIIQETMHRPNRGWLYRVYLSANMLGFWWPEEVLCFPKPTKTACNDDDGNRPNISNASSITCDCGAIKARSGHAFWCSTKENGE